MKQILFIISMLFSLTAMAEDVSCNQGDQKPPRGKEPSKQIGAEGTIPMLVSCDPNEIIGPTGYDTVRWISINDVLNYTILFENDPDFATAAAQKVDIRFDFPNKAWMRGFGIGNYSFANMSFPVAKISNAYQQRIDLKDSLGYYVDLIGGLDVAQQQGFWTFSTIDPETGYAPWQAEMGMLPVNDSTHVGEGFVTFQLKPYTGMTTGDTISIQANIVFDQNDTIATNRWCNMIDAGMPESKVTAAPLLSPQEGEGVTAYNLTFTAKDDEGGSGVRHILLYLANHSGIYEEIDTCMVDSVLTFPVENGKQYKLYTIAVDNTGNREPAKMEPDVILNFNVAPTDIVLSDSLFQDDIPAGGFIAEMTSEDNEEGTFTYALAEGDGAIHNDLFQISGSQLQAKAAFKSAEDSIYKIRVSTTDEGGLSYSEAFTLSMKFVLERPKPDTLAVTICEGDVCEFHGSEYEQTGTYVHAVSNEYMRDSLYVLQLTVVPRLDAPTITVEGSHTLVSSAAKGNQWLFEDGTMVEGETGQTFTPTQDGVYYVAVTNGSCFSEPSNMVRVVLTQKTTLSLNLAEGWNWISSNLADEELQSAKQFLAPIEASVERLVGESTELVNNPGSGWDGALEMLSAEEMYKIHLKENVSNQWTGTACDPENTNISLSEGWNWIGYLPVNGLPLKDALASLTPSEKDVIKGHDCFAMYENGQWTGTLTSLSPGVGYMYYANASATFHYPVTKVFPVENIVVANNHVTSPWKYRAQDYPDNMTMVAVPYTDDIQVLEGSYIIGAFVGDECRGVGQYVNGKLFLTIHGTLSENASVIFKAYETVSGKELEVEESLTFGGTHVGSQAAPYPLHIKGANSVNESLIQPYIIYPNPLRSRMFIQGDTEQIQSIQILSSAGEVKLAVDRYDNQGVDVSNLSSGVYVVAISTTQGTQYRKVVKAH